ncbi:hypothetical protein RN001_004247 [Aquatica leii]|uniref:Spaetzle domain-containing protein n=1 Tax=Aquatica leii TaxID=1421715 RepID=A0AAN7PBE8_9COLE|nr:hypothetical protein RN001_004247 [Aquatica leii]
MWLFEILLIMIFCGYYWKPAELAFTDASIKRNNSGGHQLIDAVFNNKEFNARNGTKVRFASAGFKSPPFSTKVIFPDTQSQRRSFVAPTCSHPYFCEDVSSYPYEHVRSILNEHKELDIFFNVDEEPIENRIFSREDNFLCPSIQRMIFPQLLLNKDNQWKYVVNQGSEYRQGIRIETCLQDNQKCSLVEVPLLYTTICKQKFTYRKMLSLTGEGEPEGDIFVLPTACCCSYTKNVNF